MKAKTFSVATTFNLPVSAALTLQGFEHDPNEQNPVLIQLRDAVPKIDPKYIFRKRLMSDMNIWLRFNKEPIYLFGPTGCGKSSLVTQMAARLGIPLFRITGNADLEIMEVLGHYTIGEHGTEFQYGPATMAAKNGCWFLFDEFDRTDPDRMVGLNGVMEKSSSFTLAGKGGEVVTPKPGFKIFATGNTNLSGDGTGNYLTAQIHDKSVLERFGMALEVPFADEEDRLLIREAMLAVNDKDSLLEYWFDQEDMKVSINGHVKQGQAITREDFITGVMQLRDMIRKQSRDCGNLEASALERTMSVRSMERWVGYCVAYIGAVKDGISPLHYAMERSLTTLSSASTKIAIHGMVTAVFGVPHKVA